MGKMISWYCKVKNHNQRRYLRKKYSHRHPYIFYDKKYQVYVHPCKLEESWCTEPGYLCSELAHTGVVYHFEINNHLDHEHEINQVYINAYNYAKTFAIPNAYKNEYSKQEKKFIEELVERGRRDRAKDI